MSGMHGRMGRPIGLKIGMEVGLDLTIVLNYFWAWLEGRGMGGGTKTLLEPISGQTEHPIKKGHKIEKIGHPRKWLGG